MQDRKPSTDFPLLVHVKESTEEVPLGEHAKMESTTGVLEYGENWYEMLKHLAEAETIVDIYLCSNAYGNIDDKELMAAETHGVRIIYVGENYFIVGPKRPVHSSIIPMGWISMIRVHENQEATNVSLVGDDDTPFSEPMPEPSE